MKKEQENQIYKVLYCYFTLEGRDQLTYAAKEIVKLVNTKKFEKLSKNKADHKK
jgi:hypothetical protein